jgi:hypothetical protein
MPFSHSERVAQARAVLISAAVQRMLLPIGRLGAALEIDARSHRDELRRILNDVDAMCTAANEPPLTALVVDRYAAPGEPPAPDELRQDEMSQVFSHWSPP